MMMSRAEKIDIGATFQWVIVLLLPPPLSLTLRRGVGVLCVLLILILILFDLSIYARPVLLLTLLVTSLGLIFLSLGEEKETAPHHSHEVRPSN